MFWVVNKKFAFVKITSWASVVFYAIHYYGRIEFNGKSVEVRKELTAKEAMDLNKEEKLRKGSLGRYHKGDTTIRFTEKDPIIENALKIWKEEFPDALGLIDGDTCSSVPQLILDGPNEYMEKVNKLVKESEGLNYYGRDKERLNEINDEWEELTREFIGE